MAERDIFNEYEDIAARHMDRFEASGRFRKFLDSLDPDQKNEIRHYLANKVRAKQGNVNARIGM